MTASTGPLRPRGTNTRSLREHITGEIDAEMGRQRLSRAAVAEALGIAAPTLSRRLNGDLGMSIEFLEKIAAILGVHVGDWFTTWTPPAPLAQLAEQLTLNQRVQTQTPPPLALAA